jgi:hypothetical protein
LRQKGENQHDKYLAEKSRKKKWRITQQESHLVAKQEIKMTDYTCSLQGRNDK